MAIEEQRAGRADHDLIVVGGGIIGCGIAHDAATRGLRVALIEQEDFGAGTSAASTRLIHGGLRYLEQLDIALVRQDLAERELLLHNAPHLVRPLPFLIPLYRQGWLFRAKLRVGLLLYDLLSYDRGLPGHRALSAAAVRALEPALTPDGLEGGFLYHDAQIELAERLCLENVLAATAAGAVALNHTRVERVERAPDGAVRGVVARDQLTGAERRLTARVVINATGPWLDETLSLSLPGRPPVLRRTKGVHLVTPPTVERAIVLFAPDGRLFFIVPWLGYSYVGTTDTDFDGDPAAAAADRADIDYLVAAVATALPDGPWREIHYTTAGVRALVRRDGAHPSAVSRAHKIVDHAADGAPGLLSVVGGKLTAYRGIAEEAVDAACRRLEVIARARTRSLRLPGAVGLDANAVAALRQTALAAGLDATQADHLVRVLGARAAEVVALVAAEPRLAERIHPDTPDCLAQLHLGVRREHARTLADVLLRRTTVGFGRRQGLGAADTAAAELARALGRDADFARATATDYRRQVARMRGQATSDAPAPVGGWAPRA